MIKTTATSFHPPRPASSALEVSQNHDLLIEILLRLPIKSLIKFKSVSKQWLSLISNPHFSLRRSGSSATGLFVSTFVSADYAPELNFIDLNNPSPKLSALPFRFLTFAGPNASIIQSCNGLLLCSNVHNIIDQTAQTFYVHNPTTRQYTTLPPLPSSPRVYGVALAFDPFKSPHYKVVCVTNPSSNTNKFLIDIYSSDGGGWRPSLLGPFKSDFDTFFNGGVFWSGSVHWISRWGPSLSFDVEEERMREMPMPPLHNVLDGMDRVCGYFGESGGHLHFVDHYLEPGESRLNVYEMKRDCSGWFVKYTVDLSELVAVFPDMILGSDHDVDVDVDDDDDDDVVPMPDNIDFLVYCVVRGEVEEGSYLVMSIPGNILRYNLESMTFCELCDDSMEHIGMHGFKMPGSYQYIESLACV